VTDAAIVRRAPFSENPHVGARGQRTQQRILDAALRTFGEQGYYQSSIDSITKVAGCSRVSFYQYFSSKEDVFRHLGAQVARQLNTSTDLLEPVTRDANGWAALRAWVGRYADIYARYRPMFLSFPAAAATDATLADDSVRTAHRYIAGVQARVRASTLSPRDLDAVVELLRESASRTLDDVSTLRTAAPDAYPEDAVLDAYTDVMHRSLFGIQSAVNVHERRFPRPPRLPFGPIMRSALDLDRTPAAGPGPPAEAPSGPPALAALLRAARQVFITRGYHGTRVDDIVEAAGVSHGAFYRYFKNKDQLAHLLAAQAMRTVSTTLAEIPDAAAAADGQAAGAALRRWLRAYNRAQTGETAMIRVWIDAALQDGNLIADSAGVLDWGRRRMMHFLEPRRFGDPDTEAIVLVALMDAFGVRERPPRMVDAAVHIIERGFLGR
jgi:AcrR family transcriptional regulator